MDKLQHYKNRVYYAQNREDLILRAFFPDVKDGFYVDVGAYDPDFESVTKFFYKQGWRGINIEPQPENYDRFTQKRKRDININAGIADKNGEMTLRSYRNGGLSTFSARMKDEYSENPSDVTDDFTDIAVPVMTLENLFDKQAVKAIHFMKVDVEGLEYEVLQGNDWKRYRPEVICIESNHVAKDWCGLLTSQNYKEVFFDGLNKYFVDFKTDRASNFNYVEYIILERGGGLRFDDYKLLAELDHEVNKLRLYADHMNVEVEERNQLIERQIVQIEDNRQKLGSLRETSRRLLSLLKTRTRQNLKRARP